MEKDLRTLIENGYIVTTRNGLRYIRIDDLLLREKGCISLCNLNPDLTVHDLWDFDVMTIHKPSNDRLDFVTGQLVWTRNSIQVGDYVRLKNDVERVRWISSDQSDIMIATKPIFKVTHQDDGRIMVGIGIILDVTQFKKVDLYDNE